MTSARAQHYWDSVTDDDENTLVMHLSGMVKSRYLALAVSYF
jgi:hypothetical protein